MGIKKRHVLWNILIVLTVLVCVFAFVEHYKNWHKIEEGNFKVFSGLYYQKIPLAELDSVLLVEKLPEMERSSGFSWLEREKGVFFDSITQSKVYVFVDDLYQHKIKLVQHDSLQLYINLQDSIQTQELFTVLQANLLQRSEQAKVVQ